MSLRRKASLLSESRGSTTRRLPAVCGPKAWALLCGVLLLWGTVAVGLSVRGAPAGATTSPRTFVDRALGSPSPDASLRRRLASGATLAIQDGSLAARDGSATIALSSSGGSDGDWRRFHGGASRATEFGRESILFGINRAEQFLTVERRQGARTWTWRLDANARQPTPRCGGRRPLQRRWAALRLPHPPGPDPRPRWTRRDAERPELVARPQRRRRLAARLAARRPEAAAAISDRPNRLDRGLRPRRRARRHDELYCGHVDRLLEPWNHQAIRGGRRRRAGRSADRSVDRGDYCARRLEPGRCDRAGCRRPDRAGALLASRRRLGARRRPRSRGRAATPTPPAGSSRTRASIRSSASTRAAAQRPRRRAEAPPRPGTRPASPSRPPPRTRCSRRPTASRTA